jgi:hypothetical protein
MKLSLVERDWGKPTFQGASPVYYLWFKVEDAAGESLVLRIEDIFWRFDPAHPHSDVTAFTERLTLLALARLVALGRDHVDELLDESYKYPTYAIHIDEQDIDELRALPGPKVCRYQSSKGGDLYCEVATGRERAGRTTRHLCGGCSWPDSRLACSHLHHGLLGFAGDETPGILEARCDTGRAEVTQNAGKCRPGGHACWVKEVAFTEAEPTTASPLALHESFDYLDAVWKNVFRKNFIQLRGAAVVGKLATPCVSSAELEAKLSALADVIKAFSIEDDDLVPGHRAHKDFAKDRTLARLQSALLNRLGAGAEEEGAASQVQEAVCVLRSAVALRTGYQHTGGGAAGKLPGAFGAFGIPYPPPSPALAWARIQSAVLRALEMLRGVLRGLD